MKVAIASDHGGFELKEAVKEYFPDCEWIDLGTDSAESTNYALFGHKMGDVITRGDVNHGVIICGSGVGISIAANRHAKVRAALCTNVEMARLSRQHNDANVIALGARIIDKDTAMACIAAFLTTDFEGGRHEERIQALDKVFE